MWEIIRSNKIKSTIFAFFMLVILVMTGFAAFELTMPGNGAPGALFAVVVWLIMLLVSFCWGDNILLSVAGAKKIQKSEITLMD